jgi:hypothetical protein
LLLFNPQVKPSSDKECTETVSLQKNALNNGKSKTAGKQKNSKNTKKHKEGEWNEEMEEESEDGNHVVIDYGDTDLDGSDSGDTCEDDELGDGERDSNKPAPTVTHKQGKRNSPPPIAVIHRNRKAAHTVIVQDEVSEGANEENDEILRLRKRLKVLEDEKKQKNDLFAEAAEKKRLEVRATRIEASKKKAGQIKENKSTGNNKKKRSNENGTQNKQKKPKAVSVTGAQEEVNDVVNNTSGKEEPIKWEIKADKNREMEEFNADGPDKKDDAVVFINNHRKELGKIGQLLFTWKYGSRWWMDINKVYEDNPKMVKEYMVKYNLISGIMGFEIPGKSPREKKREKKAVPTEEEEESILQECKMDHDNYLNYHPEGNSAYCKVGYHFFGVKCANKDCNKSFVAIKRNGK